MEAPTEEKARVHIDGLPVEVTEDEGCALPVEATEDEVCALPVEATEDEGCARAALADVEEQVIHGIKVEVCEQTLRQGSPIQHALPGESSDSGDDIQNGFYGKKIFVGGLPSDLTEDEFASFFERFGEITDAFIVLDPVTRRSRGFGFVTFDSKQSVNEVLKRSRYLIKGKNVEVKLAIPKEEISAAAQQSIENSPIVNGDDYYARFTHDIRPNIYGYHHHFNAFTLFPGMSRFPAAPQLYGNNRREPIRRRSYWVNRDIDFEEISRRSGVRITRPPIINIEGGGTSSPVVDLGSSSVDGQLGGS